jgi:hypothetical protein
MIGRMTPAKITHLDIYAATYLLYRRYVAALAANIIAMRMRQCAGHEVFRQLHAGCSVSISASALNCLCPGLGKRGEGVRL